MNRNQTIPAATAWCLSSKLERDGSYAIPPVDHISSFTRSNRLGASALCVCVHSISLEEVSHVLHVGKA